MEFTAKERELFRDRLRQLRGDTPPRVLAELCGLREKAISEYENGDSLPSYESLIKLAKYFQVSIDYMAGNTQ